MDQTENITKIKELLAKAQNILLVTHEKPSFDSMGSMLALYLGLQSLGKKVTAGAPDPVTVELSGFIGVNKVQSEIGQKNFIISLDYVDGSIEKVSYNIENNTFNLVIEPRPGFAPFSSDKVHFSHSGVAADLIIVIDTIQPAGLKKLYEKNRELFAASPIINIDRHPNNAQFGHINLVDATVSSTSELVTQVLSFLGVHLTADIATNLINALFAATNNFQGPYVSGRTFELAAACTKAGGKRFQKLTGAVLPDEEKPTADEDVSALHSAGDRQQKKVEPGTKTGKTQETPADWLKPKIFKSSNVM